MFIGSHVIICVAIVTQSLSAPNRRRPEMGPCAGMDCLHGVLMHGDSEMGEDHSKEDLYNRLEKEDAQRQQRKPDGPCNGKDCMELINHGADDPDAAHKMAQNIGPEAERRPATVDAGKALHGEEKVDHDAPRKTDGSAKVEGRPSVAGPEEALRGTETANRTDPSEDEARNPTDGRSGEAPGADDLEKALHGGKRVDHDRRRPDDKATPDERPELDGHEEARDVRAPKAKRVYESPTKDGHAHRVHAGRVTEDAVHHASHSSRGHHREHSGTLDPHALIHGERRTDAGGFDGKQSERDPKESQTSKDDDQNNDPEGGHDDNDDGHDEAAFGFSFPYISDTIMNEIEILKRRYLPRFWSEGDETEDDDDSVDVQVEDEENVEPISSNGESASESEQRKNSDVKPKGRPSNVIKSAIQVKHLPRQDEREPSNDRVKRRVEI